MRPSCVGVPGDKHCCEMSDVFCPVDEGDAPVGLRAPKGATATRSYPHALPGTSAPECCAGECLRQSYTDKSGVEKDEHYCCVDRACKGWTQEGEELENWWPQTLGAARLVCGVALMVVSPAARALVFGSAFQKRPQAHADAAASTCGSGNGDGEIEMAAVDVQGVSYMVQGEVQGVSLAYMPPVIEVTPP